MQNFQRNVRQIYLKSFLLCIWLIDFIFGDLKLSHNRQNGEHNIMFSSNPGMGARYQRLWETQDIKSDPKALRFVSKILHRQFTDKTMTDIQTAGDGKKLRTYKLFKNEFRLEHYLLKIPNQHYRCALAQFRLSSHNLGIETGRHTKPPTPQENQLCLYCDKGLVDDEVHLHTNCAAHTDIRHRLTTNNGDCLDDYNCLSDVQNFVLCYVKFKQSCN